MADTKRFYVVYSDGNSTNTCIAIAQSEDDVWAHFADKQIIAITPEGDAPSWMGEGKSYATIVCEHVASEEVTETATITASEACKLVGYRWAIVGEHMDEKYVYALYASQDEAVRISNDLNSRYGDCKYLPAKIEG
jgi:hypothetical protein